MLSALLGMTGIKRLSLHSPVTDDVSTMDTALAQAADRNLLDFQQQRHSRLFCQLACNFLVDLPGTKPLIALILDKENIILETVAIRSVQFMLHDAPLSILQPGESFQPANLLDVIPYIDMDPHAIAIPCSIPLCNVDWHSVVSAIPHPMQQDVEYRIVFLATDCTLTQELRESVITSTYAIFRLWLSTLQSMGAKIGIGSGIDCETEAEKEDLEEKLATVNILEPKLLDYEKNSSLATLCAGIAHEIRNPLTTARGFLQLFEKRCEEEDKTFLKLTINELDRIGQLLEDFMDIARPSKEILEITDLCELTYSVCKFLSPESKLRDVELTCDVPDRPVRLRLQVTRIKQVLINLLQNAVHACTPHGSVHIVIEDLDNRVSLTISDTGCGIQDLHQLFRPFHTTKKDGTGLGMFVSKQIIEQHCGKISVNSIVGEGTTLSIELPRL